MSPSTPHPIKTTGITPIVSSTKQTGESIGEWVDRHDKGVEDAAVSGNTLTTTYTSSQGGETITTTRNPGESDAELKGRHRTDYLEAFVNLPPIA